MLSSQIISVSQTSITPALLQSSIASSTAMLRSSGRLPRRSRPHHQIRTLRLGLWSSYLDPEFQKEVQRRHRITKHKYMEALNRKLSWELQNPISPRNIGFKGFMCSAWRGQDSRPGGRWVDLDELNKNNQQKNSGGIEDVEMSAFDKLLDSKGLYNRLSARSRIWLTSANNAINPILSSSTVQNDTIHRTTHGQGHYRQKVVRFRGQKAPEPELEYEIDPITNRKVLKNKCSEETRESIEVPTNTFKGYRPQFQDFAPPASQSTGPDVKTYKPLETSSQSTSDTGKQSDSARESLKDYESDRKYKPFFRYEPDSQKPESKTESLNEYDRKTSYEASRWYEQPVESFAEKTCPVQEGLSEYDRKTVYGPVMYREPDGKLPESPCPVQQGLSEYDSKVTYGPVMHNEPDGQPPVKRDTVAEGLRDFDKRADYGPRRILKNIFLGRGNGNTDKSFRYPNEDTREDLDLLRPSDVRAGSGIIKGVRKESETEKEAIRNQLEDDFQQQQSLKDTLMEELKIENSELRNHTAHLRGRVEAELAKATEEISSKPPRKKMTGNFVRDFPEEFEARWTAQKESGSLWPESEIITPETHEPAPKESFARSSNTPRIQTSLDRTAGGSHENQNAEKMARLQNDIDPKKPQGLETNCTEEITFLQHEKDPYSKKPMGLETSFADELAKARALEVERDPYSKDPQGLETSYATEKAEERNLELERDPYSKTPQGLETSYVEEVKLQNEKDPYSKKPMGLETSYAEEIAAQQGEGGLSASVSSFGKRNNAEERSRAEKLSKQAKKNLMKQMDRDLVKEIRTIYEEKYGILDSKHRQVPEPSTASEAVISSESDPEVASTVDAQEPTIYKILAYDPTMQEINTAETTSIVPDSASALTPAEVLLRLSNPAKFFPHFQPLQAEGYEIISGSGDVLVFRKVRSAGLQGSKNESASSLKRKSTNPIDGMQSSPVAATGNFASPTGFVNHDLPVGELPFKSNIDVRREEPVFSGKSNWQEDYESKGKTEKGRGKRLLIGAAWVAGCSYAIGVVAEFFRTGGMDGRGPKSF